MMSGPEDIFAKIADAAATQSGNWIRDGEYLLAIKECKYEKKFSGLTWITEFIVCWSKPILGMMQVGGEACAPGTPGAVQVEPNAVGDKVSFASVVDNKNTPNAAGNVKAFLLALSNKREAEFDFDERKAKQQRAAEEATGVPEEKRTKSPFAESCMMLISPAQPMRGALIRASTIRSVNQGKSKAENKGKILVKPTWLHVPYDANIPKRRVLIEQGLPIPAELLPAVA